MPWAVGLPSYSPIYFVHQAVIEADCTGGAMPRKSSLDLWADPEDLGKVGT